MVDEVVGKEFLEDIEIAFALHLFGVSADVSLGSFAGSPVAHCLSPITRCGENSPAQAAASSSAG
jgi:hypothetical protein